MTGNRTRLFHLTLAVLMVTAALAAGPGAASAQSEDSVVDTLFGPDTEDDDASTADRIIEAAKGTAAKFLGKAAGAGGDEVDAEQYAQDAKESFNANSTGLETWANSRVNADPEYDTIRLKFTDEDGGTEWLFITAEANTTTGNYSGAKAMNLTEFRSVDREVDATYRLTPFASDMADTEVDRFVARFVDPGEDVDQKYLANLAGKYRGELTGDELPGGDA